MGLHAKFCKSFRVPLSMPRKKKQLRKRPSRLLVISGLAFALVVTVLVQNVVMARRGETLQAVVTDTSMTAEPACGDGVVQRPNDDGQYEECDGDAVSLCPLVYDTV